MFFLAGLQTVPTQEDTFTFLEMTRRRFAYLKRAGRTEYKEIQIATANIVFPLKTVFKNADPTPIHTHTIVNNPLKP